MGFREQLKKDQDVFYNAEEFGTVASLADGTTVTLLRFDDDEFGEAEHQLYKIRADDRELLNVGDVLTINGVEREILAFDDVEAHLGLEFKLTFMENNLYE